MRFSYRFRDDGDGHRGGSFDDLDQDGRNQSDPESRHHEDASGRFAEDPANANEGMAGGKHSLSDVHGKDAQDQGPKDDVNAKDFVSADGGEEGTGSDQANGSGDGGSAGMDATAHGMGKGAIASAAGGVGVAVSGVIRGVATALHVPPKVVSIVGSLLLAGGLVTGGLALGAGFLSNNYHEEVFWIDDDPCENYDTSECDKEGDGAEAYAKAAEKELEEWNAGVANHRRYEDHFEQNGDGSGWCAMFVGHCAGELGSTCTSWQGDAFPAEPTTPDHYHTWYEEHPDAGKVYSEDAGEKPQAGDVFICGKPGNHVGIVVETDDTGYWVIEGGGATLDRNHYDFGAGNHWFARPNFKKIANPKFQTKSKNCDKTGQGDIQIPETMEFINDLEHGSVCPGPAKIKALMGDVASWEGNVNVPNGLRSLGLIGDVLKMADFYDANGGYTDAAGFERIKNVNDYYILAIGAYPYAAPGNDMVNVGDHLTLYYDDGTEVDALVGDWKGWEYERNPSLDPTDESSWVYIETELDPQGRTGYGAGWGHGPAQSDDGQWHCTITEFWGYDGSRNPMAGPLQESTGGSMTRLVGITNHGLCPEFQAFGGGTEAGTMVDSATSSKTRQNKKKENGETFDCKSEKRKVDNSTLAAAMASYSYSQRKDFHDADGKTYPGTKIYDELWTEIINDGYYRSCDRGVAIAAIWTGADLDFHYGGCQDEHDHLASTTNLWKLVAEDVVLDGNDEDAIKKYDLWPGDIFCTKENLHTFAYVGADVVKQVYESTLKGTDADVGAPEDGACWMGASIGSDGTESTRDSGPDSGRAPGLYANASDSRPYDVFRYIGNYPDKDKYAELGTKATAKAKGGSPAPCECMEEEEEEEDEKDKNKASGKAAEMIEKAKSIIGAAHSMSGYNWTGDVSTSYFTCSGVIDFIRDLPPCSNSPESYWDQVGSNMVHDSSQLNPGDLVFYPYAGRYPGHIGLYIGDGQIIDSIPNGGVQIRDVNYMELLGGGPLPEGS